MPYSRIVEAGELSKGSRLTCDMVGVGMLFAASASPEPNIEDTLIGASVEGMERDDLRVLAVLTTWLRIHHPRVNADRLLRAVQGHPSTRVRAYWSAIGTWLGKDRRMARLETVHQGRRVEVLRSGTAFRIRRKGEDPRFLKTRLRVPGGVLRDRDADVLSPTELARRHATYRWRIIMGPSYRADMWAVLEAEPLVTATDLARRTYGSFATAWNIKQDWDVLNPA